MMEADILVHAYRKAPVAVKPDENPFTAFSLGYLHGIRQTAYELRNEIHNLMEDMDHPTDMSRSERNQWNSDRDYNRALWDILEVLKQIREPFPE